jgi:hypothetical protein
MNLEKCVICESEFYENALENGKCAICRAEYPTADTREEAVRQTTPEKEQALNLTEDRVKHIVADAFADVKGSIQEMIDTAVNNKINEYLGSDD